MKEVTTVKAPLKTVFIIVGVFLLPTLILFLLGPGVYIKTWFDSKSRVLEAEAMRRAIDIVGEEFYIRNGACQKQ